MRYLGILSLLLAMVCGYTGAAMVPAVTLDPGFEGGYSTITNSTRGWEFTVNEEIIVVALGIYDYKQDGLAGSHEIGIWEEGNILYSATIPAGDETLLVNEFRYIEIPGLTLEVGKTYVIGSHHYGVDERAGQDSISTITMTDTVNYVKRLISASDSGFSLPTDERDYHSFGPNFLVVPEPISLLLMSTGLIFIRKK